ncbi:MAG TPA: DNA translocase FtsK 4TM domain-containing protein [Acidimicrobiales bacterium]|nr:DNA translocase FtsK 4TM domain-containing protein [Acidimicrobiales bacterium]
MVVVAARHQKRTVTKGRARPAARKGSAPDSFWRRHESDLWILVLIVLGLLALLAEAHALGPAGRVVSRALALTLGVGRFAVPVVFVGLGVAMISGKVELERARLSWGVGLTLLSLCGLAHLARGHPKLNDTSAALGHAGGWLGVLAGGGPRAVIGAAGAAVLLSALLVVALIITTGVGLRSLARGVGRTLRFLGHSFFGWWRMRPRSDDTVNEEENDEPDVVEPVAAPIADFEPYEPEDAPVEYEEEVYGEQVPESEPVAAARPAAVAPVTQWRLPPVSLLLRTKELKQDRTAIDLAGDELVEALAAHGVETTLIGYTVGPTVTRFELELGPGVKVSRVTSLNKDIAYALAAPDVRILAPIPGRSAIGVEVPNRQRSLVALGDLLATEEASAARDPLDVPIGRDISGKTVIVNLAELPHVLVSGATGAGKSSGLNSIITSLVMRATPDQMRLILVDPKRVEMGQYNDLPHLLAPVVVDPKRAAGTLNWAVKEMERRYDVLAASGARDITSYQQMIERGELEPGPSDAQRVAQSIEDATGLESDVAPPPGPEELPYIVIVVDELNDLMMVAARDVEESVVRIAQMARAVGIHLVLATQRPSVDVITGVIKANIPSRMAYAVSSLADSRVILDQAGAERLIGKGDMLLVTASSNVARRLQSPWVSEDEVRRVVEFWRAQGGRRETVVSDHVDESRAGWGTSAGDDDDEVLMRARDLVLRTQTGSTSMLQRKLRVGFARAGRLMDQLEEEGIVAAGDGSKSRKVLMTLEQYEATL